MPPVTAKGASEQETEEGFERHRRVMFVGMTRAMRALLLVTPNSSSPLFTGFDARLWNTEAQPPV
jgi:superfamily I DNA/RNA helicase